MSKKRGLPESSKMRHDSHFVEQLFRADEVPLGRRLPMHLIEANPDQPRTVLGDLSELVRSISEKGVLEPILVRPREDGRFTIISGERRFRAAMEAGLAEIPCIEMDVSDAELIEIALIENLQRKDLTPFEEGEGYSTLQNKYGYTHQRIAKIVAKSRVTITETLSLLGLPSTVREACRRADITSKSFLLAIGRLEAEDLMLAAVESYASGVGAGRDAVREMKRRGDKTPVVSGPLTAVQNKSYELNWAPQNAPYRVTVVLKGSLQTRTEIIAAIRDLLSRIQAGEIDLEAAGRFPKPRTRGK